MRQPRRDELEPKSIDKISETQTYKYKPLRQKLILKDNEVQATHNGLRNRIIEL